MAADVAQAAAAAVTEDPRHKLLAAPPPRSLHFHGIVAHSRDLLYLAERTATRRAHNATCHQGYMSACLSVGRHIPALS